jgi:NDP-sugar pyrophosphorylase family protein
MVTHIGPMQQSGHWLNGGFFRFRREIFDHLRPGEELVEEPFRRLTETETGTPTSSQVLVVQRQTRSALGGTSA